MIVCRMTMILGNFGVNVVVSYYSLVFIRAFASKGSNFKFCLCAIETI